MLGTTFTLSNVWYAFARSTIPLALSGEVTQKIRLLEKHRGVDDVYMVVLDGHRSVQVDQPIFAAVSIGSSLSKAAWSRRLRVDQDELRLHASSDLVGMLIVMPALLLLSIYLAWAGDQPAADGSTPP